MQKKVIASPLAPKAVGPYSQAIAAGTTLYVSGQLPIDAATGLMAEGIEAQTQRALENISAILAEAGYALSDVVKTTVLLQDIGDFAAMNGVYATYFTGALPARVCYEVARLPMGARVEIDAVAVKACRVGAVRAGRLRVAAPRATAPHGGMYRLPAACGTVHLRFGGVAHSDSEERFVDSFRELFRFERPVLRFLAFFLTLPQKVIPFTKPI